MKGFSSWCVEMLDILKQCCHWITMTQYTNEKKMCFNHDVQSNPKAVSVSRTTTLVQTEISSQLVDGLTFMVPRG